MIAKAISVIAVALGLLLILNGLYMIAAPGSWYASVPGVAGTGPLNRHFVIDIGMLYLTIGSAFAAGAVWTGGRLALWLFATFWLVSHALFHLEEALRDSKTGILLARDFVGVTLPALLGLLLVLRAALVRPARPHNERNIP